MMRQNPSITAATTFSWLRFPLLLLGRLLCTSFTATTTTTTHGLVLSTTTTMMKAAKTNNDNHNNNNNNNSAGGPFCLNVKMAVRPERRAEFLQVIQYDQHETMNAQKEPHALQFVVGEDTLTPNTFYLHEQYQSQADFDFHTTTPHFAQWTAFCDSKPFVDDDSSIVVDKYIGTHEAVRIPVRPAYCLNVELAIQPALREEFLKVIDNNQAGTTNPELEPLALQYHYGENMDIPHTFHFHEQYTGENGGQQGFDAHAAAPHFAQWEDFVATSNPPDGPFTKPPIVSFYQTLE